MRYVPSTHFQVPKPQVYKVLHPRWTHASAVYEEWPNTVPTLNTLIMQVGRHFSNDLTNLRGCFCHGAEALAVLNTADACKHESVDETTPLTYLNEGDVTTSTVHCNALAISLSGKIPVAKVMIYNQCAQATTEWNPLLGRVSLHA